MIRHSRTSAAALLVAMALAAPAGAQTSTTTTGTAPTTTTGAMTATTDAPVAMQGATTLLTTAPAGSVTVTRYYQQDVYDPADDKIGEVKDVLIDNEGKVSALIVAVGGFLGMGEKDVAVSFDAVHATQKDDDWHLSMDTTKDALTEAPGYKYDSETGEWQLDVK